MLDVRKKSDRALAVALVPALIVIAVDQNGPLALIVAFGTFVVVRAFMGLR